MNCVPYNGLNAAVAVKLREEQVANIFAAAPRGSFAAVPMRGNLAGPAIRANRVSGNWGRTWNGNWGHHHHRHFFIGACLQRLSV
jgi:hypothetical protein